MWANPPDLNVDRMAPVMYLRTVSHQIVFPLDDRSVSLSTSSGRVSVPRNIPSIQHISDILSTEYLQLSQLLNPSRCGILMLVGEGLYAQPRLLGRN